MQGSEQQSSIKGRLMSLDALRGFMMFWLIGGWWVFVGLDEIWPNAVTRQIDNQLQHVDWAGFHFEDLIMPLFLFIVGVVMPYSFSKRLERGDSKKKLYLHVVRRALVLFILGGICAGNWLDYDLSDFYIYSNVLQSIAIAYLVASILIMNLDIKWQMVATVFLLMVHWAILEWAPVPGYGAGVLTLEGNFAFYLDKLILGRFRPPWNYSWILNSFTLSAMVMSGVMAGHLLHLDKTGKAKVRWFLLIGICCLILGLAWWLRLPVIKRIWTSSFVVFSAGWCYLLLALSYLIIDVWGYKKWAFVFIVIGMNSISAFVATQVFDFKHVGNVLVGGFARWLSPEWRYMVQHSAALVIVWLILWWMYRKKSFIKV